MKMRIWGLLLAVLLVACGNDASDKDGVDGNGTDDNDSETGRVIPGGDADSDSDSDSDADSDSNGSSGQCAEIDWSVEVKTINMLVLLDRSRSMYEKTIGDQTYAEVVEEAINTVVASNTNAGVINFALNVFPSADTCPDVDEADLDLGCVAASGFDYSPDAVSEYSAPLVEFSGEFTDKNRQSIIDNIASKLSTVGQCGGTPIGDSLRWADQYLQDNNMPANDTYVLLATDGAPNCNDANPAGGDCDASKKGQDPVVPILCLDDVNSYNAALSLALNDYEVFVIGVGNDVQEFAEVMNGLAYFGQVESPPATQDVPDPETDRYYFPAEDAAALNAALEDITNLVVDCEYEVDWSMVPNFTTSGVEVSKTCVDISLSGDLKNGDDGPSIPYVGDCSALADGEYGWFWVESPGASFDEIKALNKNYAKCANVQLCPTTCANLKTEDGTPQAWSGVSATFGCETEYIPIIN